MPTSNSLDDSPELVIASNLAFHIGFLKKKQKGTIPVLFFPYYLYFHYK